METDVLEKSPFNELECRGILPFPSFQHGYPFLTCCTPLNVQLVHKTDRLATEKSEIPDRNGSEKVAGTSSAWHPSGHLAISF